MKANSVNKQSVVFSGVMYTVNYYKDYAQLMMAKNVNTMNKEICKESWINEGKNCINRVNGGIQFERRM